jgi:hypothetical protein
LVFANSCDPSKEKERINDILCENLRILANEAIAIQVTAPQPGSMQLAGVASE